MGGLKVEIADGIRMFKPQSLKDATSLAKMRDDQITRQQSYVRLLPAPTQVPLALPPTTRADFIVPTTPIRRLSWEQMQRKRKQGLCFYCNEYFTPGYRCRKSQLLLLEGHNDESDTFVEESLVQWKYLIVEESTRNKKNTNLMNQFSNVDLEDKHPFGQRSIDKPRHTPKAKSQIFCVTTRWIVDLYGSLITAYLTSVFYYRYASAPPSSTSAPPPHFKNPSRARTSSSGGGGGLGSQAPSKSAI
ncbi:hypothetical protein FNV43_RR00753 [Rhamnella rubrinervis]|uniref:Uncharacterized protein n=1 Tax=Rhamnella rubrinervis TaxID=2594499 RepID=A0A8K0HND5_9ROSA|nr:hypothetical protein FNV43_RR00753 [Rhamnella rubrinervis]